MKNNIDEDIKILEKYKIKLLNTIKEIEMVEDFRNHHVEKQYNRCKKRVKAIENVLSELEELRKHDIRKIEIKNGEIEKAPSFTKEQIKYMNLGIALKETTEKSELETFKKIAEKLADEYKKENIYFDSNGFNFCDLSYEEDYEKHGKCTKYNNGDSCIQCILDWARNEVEKDG